MQRLPMIFHFHLPFFVKKKKRCEVLSNLQFGGIAPLQSRIHAFRLCWVNATFITLYARQTMYTSVCLIHSTTIHTRIYENKLFRSYMTYKKKLDLFYLFFGMLPLGRWRVIRIDGFVVVDGFRKFE